MRTVWIGGGVGCGWEAGDEGEGDCDARDWCLAVICVLVLFFLVLHSGSHKGWNQLWVGLLIDTAGNSCQITVENHIKLGLSCIGGCVCGSDRY